MKIQWLGTAGFRFEHDGSVILIDPYLSRNPDARPVQALTPGDLASGKPGPVSHILISHGHFDHLMDIPEIARETCARVCCSPEAARTLVAAGLDPDQIRVVDQDGWSGEAGAFTVEAFYSSHVRFDLKLVARTLVRAGRRFYRLLPLFREYPCGQVLGWRIRVRGKTILFFGSAGATGPELSRLRKIGPVDLLLVPLQGHSRICHIGLNMVLQLEPAMVIPHHHDDFYPPLSQAVDISLFLDGMRRQMPGLRLRIPEINREILVWD